MAPLILAILWFAAVAVLIIRAVRQYGAYEKLTAADMGGSRDSIAVIVPARNEQDRIESCLESLLAQRGLEGSMRIIAIDDDSTDRTSQIIGNLAARDGRLEMISLDGLETGWKGKPHACWRGAEAALNVRQPPDWICFIDADTHSEPALLSAAIAHARARKIDMLSLEPFQALQTFWERLLIPAGFFLLAFSQDLRKVNDPHRREACANGQFLLFRREAYEAIRGHQSVRGELSEDTALARRVKQRGYRLAVIGAESLITTRMYTGLRSIWNGVSRSLVDMVGGVSWTIVFALIGLIIALAAVGVPLAGWLLPSPLAPLAAILATIASIALFGVHVGAAAYFRIPFWYGLLFPLAYLFGLPLALNSIQVRARHRITWKDRMYAEPVGTSRTRKTQGAKLQRPGSELQIRKNAPKGENLNRAI